MGGISQWRYARGLSRPSRLRPASNRAINRKWHATEAGSNEARMRRGGALARNRETAKWDPAFTKRVARVLGPVGKRWYRAEVRNIGNVPPTRGALVVSNHSGGMMTSAR